MALLESPSLGIRGAKIAVVEIDVPKAGAKRALYY
jgi:hypothetical protein